VAHVQSPQGPLIQPLQIQPVLPAGQGEGDAHVAGVQRVRKEHFFPLSLKPGPLYLAPIQAPGAGQEANSSPIQVVDRL
jgi:hypothetical protein